jgi:hypothetical protein
VGLRGRSLELRVRSLMTSGSRFNPKVSLPIATYVGVAGASTGYLRFLKTVCVCVVKRDLNSWLMLVLGIRGVEAGALAISGGVQDDDAALLSCLERVSYAKVFLA